MREQTRWLRHGSRLDPPEHFTDAGASHKRMANRPGPMSTLEWLDAREADVLIAGGAVGRVAPVSTDNVKLRSAVDPPPVDQSKKTVPFAFPLWRV